MRKRFATLEEAFLTQITKTDACWLWNGAKAGKSYGQVAAGGKRAYAHRYAWEREDGPIPDGLNTLHSCDNPPCVRRSHLFLGTKLDNAHDMVSKGRSLVGTHNPANRLSEIDVVAIRVLFLHRRISMRRIALGFGVSVSTVRFLLKGRTWAHLPCEIPPDLFRQITKTTQPEKKAFTEEQERKIVAEYRDGGCTTRSLGKKYGVHNSTISLTLRRTAQ